MDNKDLLLVSKGITGIDSKKWVKRANYSWRQLDKCFSDAKLLYSKGNIDTRVLKKDSSGFYSKCLGVYNDKDNSTLDISNSASIQVLAKSFLEDLGCIIPGDYGVPMVNVKQILIYDNNGTVGVVIYERFSLNTLSIDDVRFVQYNELLSVGINMGPKNFASAIQNFINGILDYTCRLDAIHVTIKPQDFPRIYYAFHQKELPTLEIGLEESDLI